MINTENKKSNRLLHEKSPYLQQHAYNPVDWYPWGDEAINAAKKANKPIFLSIGYSTCHWCHVMERESFENLEIAAVMNKHFINIKVDREERPDLDTIYMTSVQLITGGGGWPMSVWLTPELKPFYGGTYYPPDDRYGRPGFKSVLERIAHVWKNEKKQIFESADKITEAIHQQNSMGLGRQADIANVDAILDKTYSSFSERYDATYGGFGQAPKFPNPGNLNFLLTYYGRTKNEEPLTMVSHTLKQMANGGIYDQLGGGFARYSTDENWVVPHFEKMLYDNAQLLSVLTSLYQINKDAFFKEIIDESVTYLLRDMRHSGGAFYSAEDADSEGKEGTFYLWKKEEIKKLLGDEGADLFNARYGVTEMGNFKDPHHPEPGQNILTRAMPVKEVAKKFKKSESETLKILGAAKKRLFDVRSKRVRPHLDDKILTSWNGLLISGLSSAGSVLGTSSYVEAAHQAAVFIEKNLYDQKTNTLYRRWRDGEKKIRAHQIDYALLVQGLIDLFEAGGDPHWLSWAVILHEQQNKLFFDPKEGGYYMTEPLDNLLVRIKEDGDNVIPSGNSVAILNGFRLGSIAGRTDFEAAARKTLALFSAILDRFPASVPKMLTALDFDAKGHYQLVILGSQGADDTHHLRNLVQDLYLPSKVVIPVDPATTQKELATIASFIKPMAMQDGKATVYVCENHACKKPTSDLAVARQQLNDLVKK